MLDTLYEIASWTELSILIPLVIIFWLKPKGGNNRPLVIYVILAAITNVLIIAIVKHKGLLDFLPKSNHLFYNLHSIVKVLCWGLYLSAFKELKSSKLIRLSLLCFAFFIIVNFLFFEPITIISARLMNIENILLLVYCVAFFLSTILDNSDKIWMNETIFFVAAGINFYAAISFFVFLFFNYFNVYEKEKKEFLDIIILFFAYSYFILCCIIAWALLKDSKKALTPNKA